MANVHFTIPEGKPADQIVEMLAIQGASAVLVAAIEAKLFGYDDWETMGKMIETVKQALSKPSLK